ncbi:MAG TPA: hypothetical protein VJS89_08375 [Gammaproteobacteria bacterium]|nr:hypothetical protein [Gammaproteobacteria bacterium]
MDINPEQIAAARASKRNDLHMEMRKVVALELIADTLEAIRQDIAGVINSKTADAKLFRRSGT